MLKNRIIYVVMLLLLCLFRIAYTGYVAGMLLVIVLVLPVFSWLVSLPGALYTRISLTSPDQVILGSQATVTLTISSGVPDAGQAIVDGSGGIIYVDPNEAAGSTTGHHHSWQDLGNGHRVCTVCLETQ